MPRMAGRLLGTLLVAAEPAMSSTALGTELGVSKGSISSMTRLLLQLGMIEREHRRGERADYFRLRADVSGHLTSGFVESMSDVRALAERGLALGEAMHPQNRALLADLLDLDSVLAREFPALLERWARERTG